jgi:hypothetical protein
MSETPVNPLTQAGGIGTDQTTRQSAEHGGSYAHRPAPHMEPAPVIPADHLAAASVEADCDAEAMAE